MRDQILGCILGGAIGDALGGPHEGKRPPVEISDNDEWRLSDDTQLTLATCEAISSCGGDTDTIASIAGKVMGALIGRGRLPEEMIARAPERGPVEAIAGAFAESLNFYE